MNEKILPRTADLLFTDYVYVEKADLLDACDTVLTRLNEMPQLLVTVIDDYLADLPESKCVTADESLPSAACMCHDLTVVRLSRAERIELGLDAKQTSVSLIDLSTWLVEGVPSANGAMAAVGRQWRAVLGEASPSVDDERRDLLGRLIDCKTRHDTTVWDALVVKHDAAAVAMDMLSELMGEKVDWTAEVSCRNLREAVQNNGCAQFVLPAVDADRLVLLAQEGNGVSTVEQLRGVVGLLDKMAMQADELGQETLYERMAPTAATVRRGVPVWGAAYTAG